jgi:predicted small secreted protein
MPKAVYPQDCRQTSIVRPVRSFLTLLSVASISLAFLSISGCNTMRGFGKDVERGGEKVQDAATPKQGTPPKNQ